MKKILIVEDDKIFALSLKITLLKMGYEVLKPVDTAELGFNSAILHKPDVILMDILLKGNETGIDAALNINEVTQIPVIFMTGNTEMLKKENLESKLRYFIHSKPINEKDIINTIEALV